MDTPSQIPPEPSGPSLLSAAFWGGLIGGAANAFLNAGDRLRSGLIGTVAGAVGAVGANYFIQWLRGAPKDTVPPAPPLPPAPPGPPQPMLLSQVPQILDLLAQEGKVTPEQQQAVLTKIKQGEKGFAGEIALREGFITRPALDEALASQAIAKTKMALLDMQRIGQEGTLTHPAWLKPNWGNNGVNPAATPPTMVDGVSSAANIAQNLVMAANASPQALPELVPGIVAASNLARGIVQGDSATVPLQKLHGEWRQAMEQALRISVAKGYSQPADAQGKPVDIEQFIAARGKEIDAGVTQSLSRTPPEPGRSR